MLKNFTSTRPFAVATALSLLNCVSALADPPVATGSSVPVTEPAAAKRKEEAAAAPVARKPDAEKGELPSSLPVYHVMLVDEKGQPVTHQIDCFGSGGVAGGGAASPSVKNPVGNTTGGCTGTFMVNGTQDVHYIRIDAAAGVAGKLPTAEVNFYWVTRRLSGQDKQGGAKDTSLRVPAPSQEKDLLMGLHAKATPSALTASPIVLMVRAGSTVDTSGSHASLGVKFMNLYIDRNTGVAGFSGYQLQGDLALDVSKIMLLTVKGEVGPYTSGLAGTKPGMLTTADGKSHVVEGTTADSYIWTAGARASFPIVGQSLAFSLEGAYSRFKYTARTVEPIGASGVPTPGVEHPVVAADWNAGIALGGKF